MNYAIHYEIWEVNNVIIRTSVITKIWNKNYFFCLDNGQGETMRGCFNSVIASLIFPSDNDKIEPGCYPIPRKLGIGTLCVCDSNLCNSAPSLRLGSTIMPSMNFPFSSILRYFIINKIHVGLLMVAVMFERIALR